jgi:SAM-dependent methyltransferase
MNISANINKFKAKGLLWSILRILEKIEFRIFGIKRQKSKAIEFLCNGDCIEIGALSTPAILPNADSIEYADIYSADEARLSLENLGYLGYHGQKFVDVTIKFDSTSPPLKNVASASKDCIFSSHSLEHSPNPISALVDYLRVLKSGGIIYSIIPNKNFTYDKKRELTKVEYLIERYQLDIWTYNLDQYHDVFNNTIDHEVYSNKTNQDIVKAYNENDGHHHIFVYGPENTIQIIDFLTENFGCTLVHFDISNQSDIHFALKKD